MLSLLGSALHDEAMEEALYYNAVAVALEGDYRRIAKLAQRFPDWKSTYDSFRQNDSPPDAEAAWKLLGAIGVRLVLLGDEAFPPILREIHHPPFGIYLLGELPSENTMAIVGTRRATPDGKLIAKRFARELARGGFTIVSGLALGIDAAAHEGCLEAKGRTIAVLASGLNAIYPATNENLGRKIIENGGAIISEYPLDSSPLPYRFLERNRIVSGLSKGVLVVECPKESGSLATARFALEQNRDVFVVPGNISHPNFFGSHALIRQGAELVTMPEDIFESYGIIREEKMSHEENVGTPEEKLVLKALRSISAPADVDKIIEMTTLEPRIINQALSFLLIKNVIRETEEGYTIT